MIYLFSRFGLLPKAPIYASRRISALSMYDGSVYFPNTVGYMALFFEKNSFQNIRTTRFAGNALPDWFVETRTTDWESQKATIGLLKPSSKREGFYSFL